MVTVGVRVRSARLAHEPLAGLLGQVALLLALALSVGLRPPGWLAGAAYAAVLWAGLTRGLNRYGMTSLGAANAVTLGRATLVGGVTALVADSVSGRAPVAVLVALAAVALALDGVDGLVARRTGTTTPLGARFDMEVDSFLLLVLSVYLAGTVGWWVLGIGLLRYAFGAAGWALPWLRAALPPRFSRKTVAATQGIVLAAASSGVLPRWLTLASVAAALALLVWSFARDTHWLWRTRRDGRLNDQLPGARY
jgi:phosphatidylglycerophosphate synthase